MTETNTNLQKENKAKTKHRASQATAPLPAMPNSPLFSKFHPGKLILQKGNSAVFHFATCVSMQQNNYF